MLTASCIIPSLLDSSGPYWGWGVQSIAEEERGGKRKERAEGEEEGQERRALLKGKVPLVLTESHRKAALQRAGPTLFPALR